MANATLLYTLGIRIFPDLVPVGLGAQKHARNMVYKLYNGNLNLQTDPTIPRPFMNISDLMVMCLTYIHISNIFLYWFTSRPFILLHSIFRLFVIVSNFSFDPCL